MVGIFFLIIPAFSAAIFSMDSPRNSWWSWEIEVITEIFGIMTLLLSSLPPSPVSSRVKSDLVFEAASKKQAEVISKNVMGSLLLISFVFFN